MNFKTALIYVAIVAAGVIIANLATPSINKMLGR